MKFAKKIAVVLALVMAFGAGTACKKKVPDSETDLEIFVWKNGYGTEFVDAIKAEFSKEYPQYNVILRSSSEDEFGGNIELGAKYNSVDLYFTSSPNQTLNGYLEPLDDVLSGRYGNESKTIAEKYDPELLNNFRNSEDGTFVLSYASSYISIAYKTDLISDAEVPRTTNQLIELTESLVRKNKTPFVHFATEGYWAYFYPVWQAQYDGMDYFKNNFLTLTDEQGKSPSKEVFKKADGRREAIKVLEQLITDDRCAIGSSSQDFTTAQTKFLNDDNIAMMVTGTWLQNEMKSDNKKVKMMKTPVVSSITEGPQLAGKTEIDNDDELSALIDAIDKASTAADVPLSGEGYDVNENDVKVVFEARNVMYCISDDNGMCVPNYAVAKEAAKDFIRFFHSDKAMKIYENVMKMPLPYKYSDGSEYDVSGWTDWSKDILKFSRNAVPLMMKVVKKSDLFLSGGATPYVGLVPIIEFTKTSGRPSTATLWQRLETEIDENWSKYLTNAGITEA